MRQRSYRERLRSREACGLLGHEKRLIALPMIVRVAPLVRLLRLVAKTPMPMQVRQVGPHPKRVVLSGDFVQGFVAVKVEHPRVTRPVSLVRSLHPLST